MDRGGTGVPTPASATFTIAPPEPTFHKTVVVEEASGRVRVKVKGSNTFVPLDEVQGIPLGSTVDARSGVAVLSSQPKPGAEAQSAKIYAGIFRVTQPRSITNLKLVEKLSCGQDGKATIAARRKRTRRLWGDGSGKFRTEGQYSSATVRGTKWLTEDSCSSTLTRVVRGRVSSATSSRRRRSS